MGNYKFTTKTSINGKSELRGRNWTFSYQVFAWAKFQTTEIDSYWKFYKILIGGSGIEKNRAFIGDVFDGNSSDDFILLACLFSKRACASDGEQIGVDFWIAVSKLWSFHLQALFSTFTSLRARSKRHVAFFAIIREREGERYRGEKRSIFSRRSKNTGTLKYGFIKY